MTAQADDERMQSAVAGRGWRRAWIGGLAVLLLALGWLGWLLGSEAGLHAALRVAERGSEGVFRVERAQGRLWGALQLDGVHVQSGDLKLAVSTLTLTWRPLDLLKARLHVDQLMLGRVEIVQRSGAADTGPPAVPASLALPLAVAVERLHIASVAVDTVAADESLQFRAGRAMQLEDIALSYAGNDEHHRINVLQLGLPFGRLGLNAEIKAIAPFLLQLDATLEGLIDPSHLPESAAFDEQARAFRAVMEATGQLSDIEMTLSAHALGLEGEGRAGLTPFEAMPLRMLALKLGEFDPSMFVPTAPRAALALDVALGPDGHGGLSGPLGLHNRASMSLDRGGLPMERLTAQMQLSPRFVRVEDLQLALAGEGRIAGRLAWLAADAGRVEDWGRVDALLEFAGINPAALDSRLPGQRLDGQIRADADAGGQRADVALQAGPARLDARAELSAAEADGARPFAIDATLKGFEPRRVLADAPEARFNLTLGGQGRLAERLSLSARIDIVDSHVERRPLVARAALTIDGERIHDIDARLDLAGNQLEARGAWGLPDDRLILKLEAPALAELGHGLGGRAGLRAELSGSVDEPSGTTTFFAESLRLPGDLQIDGLNGEGMLAAGAEGDFRLAVGLSGWGPTGKPAWVEAAHLSAEGRRAAHDIRLEVVGAEDAGLHIALQGGLSTLSDRALAWIGQLRVLETAGPLLAHLEAPAGLSVSAERVELAEAVLRSGERGRIRLLETYWSPMRSSVRGDMTGLSFGLVSRADGRPRRGPGPLVLGAEWAVSLADTLEGDVRLFRESGDLTVTGEIRTRLGLEHFESRLVARENRLALSLAARGEELGELSGTATAQLQKGEDGGWQLDPDAPLLGSVRLAMPSLVWVGRLMRENIETGGRLDAAFSVSGTPAAPVSRGELRGDALQLALVDQGLVLSGGTLRADFDDDRLMLRDLSFVSANRVRPREGRLPVAALTATAGRFVASGEVALDSGAGAFRFEADRLPLLQRSDRWMILSGQGRAQSSWSSLDIDGDFRVDAGYVEFAETPPPSLSDDVVLLGQESVPAGSFGLSARIGVGLGEAFYLSAMGVETRLAGGLELRLAPGVPLRAVGSVTTIGGSYRGYGQSLSIERGVINFQGEIDNPGLNIVTLRKGLEVEAGVAISGSARRPQVRLVSEPAVPDPEKLSWIVLGRAPDAGGGADLALLLPAAQVLLGGPGGGMTEELSRSLGFDSFSIGQGELNSMSRTATSRVVGGGSRISAGPTVAGQVLTVGKRLSSDLFLSFEQSLGGAESLVKLTYQLGRRVSMVARGGTDNALDIYYTFSFR